MNHTLENTGDRPAGPNRQWRCLRKAQLEVLTPRKVSGLTPDGIRGMMACLGTIEECESDHVIWGKCHVPNPIPVMELSIRMI